MEPIERLLEEVLIVRCQMGDDKAFERLVERYQGRLRYFVRGLLGEADKAEDVLQNVWLTVLRKLSSLRTPEAFSVWLYRIARNKALNELRSEKRYVALREDAPIPNMSEQQEEFSAQDAAKIHAALERIRPEHREVLTLRFLEQMSYEEIAAVVGCNIGTVRSRLYYGKRALRREMEEMSNAV